MRRILKFVKDNFVTASVLGLSSWVWMHEDYTLCWGLTLGRISTDSWPKPQGTPTLSWGWLCSACAVSRGRFQSWYLSGGGSEGKNEGWWRFCLTGWGTEGGGGGLRWEVKPKPAGLCSVSEMVRASCLWLEVQEEWVSNKCRELRKEAEAGKTDVESPHLGWNEIT